MKPYYEEDNITIYNGDCLEVMEHLRGNQYDLCLTDIPYNEVNRDSNGLRVLNKKDADILNVDLDYLVQQMLDLTKGSIYIFCGHAQISPIFKTLENAGMTTRMIVWEKINPSPMNGSVVYLSGIEKCIWGKFPKATFNGFCKNTVFRYPVSRGYKHPTVKPLPLFREFIEISTNKGDTVLDPFMGSGTTLRACKDLGRKCIGIEINEEYIKIAVKRLAQEVLPL